jgi:hypothetical protein
MTLLERRYAVAVAASCNDKHLKPSGRDRVHGTMVNIQEIKIIVIWIVLDRCRFSLFT